MINIEREISDRLRELSQKYRVLTVLGPRQAGKTTSIEKVFARMTSGNFSECSNLI